MPTCTARIISFVLVLLLLSCNFTNSMTAYSRPRKEKQPDGSAIILIGHGDEKSHFETDLEDHLVLQNEDGIYGSLML